MAVKNAIYQSLVITFNSTAVQVIWLITSIVISRVGSIIMQKSIGTPVTVWSQWLLHGNEIDMVAEGVVLLSNIPKAIPCKSLLGLDALQIDTVCTSTFNTTSWGGLHWNYMAKLWKKNQTERSEALVWHVKEIMGERWPSPHANSNTIVHRDLETRTLVF